MGEGSLAWSWSRLDGSMSRVCSNTVKSCPARLCGGNALEPVQPHTSHCSTEVIHASLAWLTAMKKYLPVWLHWLTSPMWLLHQWSCSSSGPARHTGLFHSCKAARVHASGKKQLLESTREKVIWNKGRTASVWSKEKKHGSPAHCRIQQHV